jgi:uncharacterized protein (TIGR04551 family)
MSYLRSQVFVGTAFVLAGATLAEAQMTPGGPMGGMGGPTQPAAEEKKEGVAEAAPKTPGLLPTTPALPPPRGRRKRWKLFEMDGYFRLRTDWFKNFHLGFSDDPALGGAPFPRSLSCRSGASGTPCDESLSSANMRLRLEPTFNLDEGTSIHLQADVYDNQILGSTPVGMDFTGNSANLPPLGAFGNSQAPVERGVNSDRDAIRVKRVWAEVAVPLGVLKFGRQPNHWGMGIWANGGGRDPISGTYDYDADYGDNVDRVSFSGVIPGTSLRAMIASDWNVSRLVSNQTVDNRGREGHPWNLDNEDDGNSWVGVISKMDSPQEFRDTVDRGDVAFNYGVYFEYRTQSWDNDLTGFTLGGELDATNRYVPRDLKTYTPDVWAKLGVGSILVEAELLAQIGSVNRLDDFGILSSARIRKFGGAGRFTWTGMEGKLKIGLEGGFASGDQWDNTPQGRIHIANANQLGDPAVCTAQNSCTLSQFMFHRDYRIDMILWRHLIGAVTNAAYAKPFVSYQITSSIGFKVSNISSFALKPIATPGNSVMYGTEFNGDVGYQGSRIFAGFSYGVLFPFGALSHPATDPLDGGPGFGFGPDANGNRNTGDATTAHAILMRLVLGF